MWKIAGHEEAVMPRQTSSKREGQIDMKKAQEPKDKSIGTIGAEKARARANAYPDIKREELLRKGLSIIYGGDGRAKAHAGRS
jgi:hypothetical protein